MDGPLVSIIIPVYNSERFLGEALDSVIGQSYTRLEILIIDDCSTDRSWDIIKDYADKDHRIVAIRNPINLNSAATRNVGISKACGELICLQDSDDVSEKDRVLKQVEALQRFPELGAIGSFVTVIDEESRVIGVRNYPRTNKEILRTMTMYCPIGQPTMMIRKEVFGTVGMYNERFSRAQDYELWFRVLQRYDVAILEDRLIRYRRHPTQGLNRRTKENYEFTLELQRKYLFHPKFFSLKGVAAYPFKHLLRYLGPKTQMKILDLLVYDRDQG